jgi:hypothetical protein
MDLMDREKEMTQSIRMAHGKSQMVLNVDPATDLLTIREPESQMEGWRFQGRLTRFNQWYG